MELGAGTHGLLYTRKGLQWHRRYVVQRGSSLEIYNLDYVEKEVRNSKDESVNIRDLQACLAACHRMDYMSYYFIAPGVAFTTNMCILTLLETKAWVGHAHRPAQ